MKKGKFRYLDLQDTTAYFKIDGSSHIEYHRSEKYYIKSNLEWLDECKYSMKMIENTIPDFPFKPGATMIVTIEKIERDIIYYTAAVKSETWKGRLRKVE